MRVICAICETAVQAGRVAERIELAGRSRFFCCEACRRTFHEHPDLYPEALLVSAAAGAGPGVIAHALSA
jgi:YHS domain-containing protein